MHPVLSLALVLVLQLCFPAVIGDCYDDELDNNKSYNNCATCYQTLANALINTGDNKYRLSETFFPIASVQPVQVKVGYVNRASNQTIREWYWLVGGFYLIQPLELFLYRSLFFSSPKWRQGGVILVLPEQCFDTYDDLRAERHFRVLTQRVRSYSVLSLLIRYRISLSEGV